MKKGESHGLAVEALEFEHACNTLHLCAHVFDLSALWYRADRLKARYFESDLAFT